MQEKRGQFDFCMSEPEFLLSVMDRHEDWCAIICLVGEGQEINTGEAGIEEWLRALDRSFRHWQVHLPDSLSHRCELKGLKTTPDLHLATLIRSFRAEKLSDFVGHLISGDADAAARVLRRFTQLSPTDNPQPRACATYGCASGGAVMNMQAFWPRPTLRG